MDPYTIATNVSSIFSLPDVVFRVTALINSGKVTNKKLEQTILNDPALTARILKFANSSYFGFHKKVETVSHAILLIGHEELRNIAIATSVTSTFKGISSDLVDMDRFWYHSVACGVVARLLATNSDSQERFFIAGLLHSIGKLILFSQYPKESSEILSVTSNGEVVVANAERRIFGFTHAELGAELLKKWQLPPSIWKIVRYQLDPLKDDEFKNDACVLCAAVNIASCIQPYTNQRIEFEEMKLMYELADWNHLDLSSEAIDSTMTIAKLQVIEVLNAIRSE